MQREPPPKTLRQFTAEGRPRRSSADSMPIIDESAIDTLHGFLRPDQIGGMLTDIERRIIRLGGRLDAADAIGAAKEALTLCRLPAITAFAR